MADAPLNATVIPLAEEVGLFKPLNPSACCRALPVSHTRVPSLRVATEQRNVPCLDEDAVIPAISFQPVGAQSKPMRPSVCLLQSMAIRRARTAIVLGRWATGRVPRAEQRAGVVDYGTPSPSTAGESARSPLRLRSAGRPLCLPRASQGSRWQAEEQWKLLVVSAAEVALFRCERRISGRINGP